MRKNEADWAEANTLRSACSKEPEDPGGDRAGDEQPPELRIRVVLGDAPAQASAHAAKIRIQSFQKKRNRTIAVARWVATRKVMK